jgi:hypothetical protein
MRIILVTLSLGEPYTRGYTMRMIEDVLKLSDLEFYITTDCPHVIEELYKDNERIKIHTVDLTDVKTKLFISAAQNATDWNFNIRYKCVEPVMDIEDAVVIWTDCDNSFDWYDRNQIEEFITQKNSEGYDFFGPRTDWRWGGFYENYKNNRKFKEDGIFWHKIYNYDLDTNPIPEWDDSPLPAEYLLVFYNKDKKLKKFHKQWEWFYDELNKKDWVYGTWAEGFEIGVSAHVAGFKSFDIGWHHPIFAKMLVANGYKSGHRGDQHFTRA